jgi:hypothetical protein
LVFLKHQINPQKTVAGTHKGAKIQKLFQLCVGNEELEILTKDLTRFPSAMQVAVLNLLPCKYMSFLIA